MSLTPVTIPFIVFRTAAPPPSLSEPGEALFYFDVATGKLLLSQNGNPFAALDALGNGADRALDNLSPTTAINANLTPGADNVVSLGSLAKRFNSLTLGPQFLSITSLASETGTARTWRFGIDLTVSSAQGNLRLFLDGTSSDAINIAPSGFIGLGTNLPSSILDMAGATTYRGIPQPAVSPVGQGRIYFDTLSNNFKVSENGGAYVDLLGGGGPLSGPGAAADIFSCAMSINPGDVVFMTGGVNIGLASANIGGNAAIGIVASKPTSTSALVVSNGPVDTFSSLITGSYYYLSTTAGSLTTTPPVTNGTLVQQIGVATSATKLYVDIQESIIN